MCKNIFFAAKGYFTFVCTLRIKIIGLEIEIHLLAARVNERDKSERKSIDGNTELHGLCSAVAMFQLQFNFSTFRLTPKSCNTALTIHDLFAKHTKLKIYWSLALMLFYQVLSDLSAG